jgi:hypothetical protein
LKSTQRAAVRRPQVPSVATGQTKPMGTAAKQTVLIWTGKFMRQSRAEVDGPYADLLTARSPYTNALGVEPQKYFRPRNSGNREVRL